MLALLPVITSKLALKRPTVRACTLSLHRDASTIGTHKAITMQPPLRRELQDGPRPPKVARAAKARVRARVKAVVEVKPTEKERGRTKEKAKEKKKAKKVAKAVKVKAKARLMAVATSAVKREWSIHESLVRDTRIVSSLVRMEAIRMTELAEVNLSGLFARASPVKEKPWT